MKKISARWRNLYTKAGFSSFMASLLAILCGLVVGFVCCWWQTRPMPSGACWPF